MKTIIEWLKIIGVTLAVLTFVACSFWLDKVRFVY